jgi:sugar O-acyltransferase (sialic acid O-acetyltransferase NeuD family)
VLLGGGGHARQVLDAALRVGYCRPLGFVDTTDGTAPGSSHNGLVCLGGWRELEQELGKRPLGVALAFGANRARLAAAERLGRLNAERMVVVDTSSVVAEGVSLGAGTVVLARAVVGPGSAVGEACIVNAGAILPHDCELSDGVHVAPGAILGGHVSVGTCSFVGLGAVIRDHVRIGAGCTIGAGAVVVGDVEDGLTVVGVPARPLG